MTAQYAALSEAESRIVAQVIADRRQKCVDALLRVLRSIAEDSPVTEPKTYSGDDALLNYESGYADAQWEAGEAARMALEEWEANE